ncbi:hypothetical protein U0070_019791, partial [Myodes glareolus]
MWFKRHSIAIGEVPACRLVHRRQLTEANVEEIWKSMTLSYLQKVLGLDSLEEVLNTKLVNSKFIIHNVYSVSRQGVVILDDKSRPNCSDWKQPMYLGFEKDVFKTIADYYGHLKEPLLTFHLFDAFVSVL